MDQPYAAASAANQGERARTAAKDLSLSDEAQSLVERDSNVFYHQALSTPVANTIIRAEGAYLIDGDGRRYLDLHGNGVHTVGYNNPKVIDAALSQIESGLTFAPRRFTCQPTVDLAEKLISISPDGLDRALFCPGGSEAIEMSVMLAKLRTGRWKTLSYYGAFHGAGFQAIAIGADTHFSEGLGPAIPGAIHLELPDYYRNPWGWDDSDRIDEEYLRQISLQIEHNADIAAFISEPVFYNSTVPTKYFWNGVRELCDQHGVLLIFDEIYTAFGRTGKMFACEHYVTPDILVVGKGFGGGLVPYAGIIGKEELNNVGHRSIGHYTHEKNPLCAAIAGAVIDFVIENDLAAKAAALGEYFRQGLLALQDEFDLIGDVRGIGLNLAADLVQDRRTKERAIEQAHALMSFCMSRGVSFKLIQGNVLNFKPSLIISKDEIDQVLDVLHAGLDRLEL